MTQRSSRRTRAILSIALWIPSLVLCGTSFLVGATELAAPAVAHAPDESIGGWSVAASEAPLRSASPRVESAGSQLRGPGSGESPERFSVPSPSTADAATKGRAQAPPPQSRRSSARELLARSGRLSDPSTAPPSLTV